jgi:anti-sigma factor RsiW
MTGVFEDHLGLDAIVAYVDGELGLTAFQRASAHLAGCDFCAAQVAEQTAAQQYLRSAGLPRMSGSLFDSLRSIPVSLPNPQPVPGITFDAVSGQVGRSEEFGRQHPSRSRRFRLGAGALVAGLAVGASFAAAAAENPRNSPASVVSPAPVVRSAVLRTPRASTLSTGSTVQPVKRTVAR